MNIAVKDIAALVGGTIEGDPELLINRPSKIEEGGVGSISFLGNSKYESFAYSTTASALIVQQEFHPRAAIQATLIRVSDVYAAVALLLEHFNPATDLLTGISPQAVVDPTAAIGPLVFLDHFAVIGPGAVVGAGSKIHAQVYIGRNVRIGEHCILHPGVKIMHDCVVGNNCIIHANTVIGSDGFGFAPLADGSFKKIPQLGNVEIADGVEIGSNCTIDRASMGSTRIGTGVKLDNLIQIAHNVEIGSHTVIAAQTGVAGSTKIGKNCLIGGQVGLVGHIAIADGTKIQAQSGIASSIPEPNQSFFGSPAMEYGQFVRSHILFKQLPLLEKRLAALEKKSNSPE